MKKKGFFTPHSKIKVTGSRGVLIPLIQFLYTVKPVLRDQLWAKEKVAL